MDRDGKSVRVKVSTLAREVQAAIQAFCSHEPFVISVFSMQLLNRVLAFRFNPLRVAASIRELSARPPLS